VRRLTLVLVALTVVVACAPGPANRATPGPALNPTFLAITNDALGPLLLGSRNGAYLSRDAGRSWKAMAPEGVPVVAHAETARGVLLSLGPQSLEYDLALDRPLGSPHPWPGDRRVTALAASFGTHTVWALSDGDEPRMLRSKDDGRSWTAVVPTGLCRRPRALAATTASDRRPLLYAACGPRGLLVSANGGLSFQRVAGFNDARDVATCLSDPKVIVVATPLVRVTKDRGITWHDGNIVADRVAVDPRNSDLVFAIAPNGGLFASKDGGRTF
jgi:photosystem II stability/assembly factor-like uncharacterized protein